MRIMRKKLFYSMLGSLGLMITIGLQGCGQSEEQPKTNPNGTISEASKSEQGVFLIIQQTAKNPDAYVVVEKHPSSTGTRAILKDMDGNERILTEEELKKMAEAEAAKVENGTSNLTQAPTANSPGLSLGETILASAAGALIGGMIANKLAGNSNFQQHQQQQQAQSSAYQQTQRSIIRNTNASTKPKQGIFSGSKTNKSSSGGLFKNFGKKRRR